MEQERWAAGVDLGGTKIQIIQVNAFGTLGERIRCPTEVDGGAEAIEREIVDAIEELKAKVGSPPMGIGVGLAGQIEPQSGFVFFAPNLKWKNVPFQQNLLRSLGIPVVVTNDVRAATWGEWLHGAGKGCSDLLCIFVGTGIGGGIVTHNQIVSGNSNTAGEVGHLIVKMDGPSCTCGSRGCVEALAGGWAIAREGQELAERDPDAARRIIALAAGDASAITGKEVTEAFHEGDSAATAIIEQAIDALAAATTSLVNTLNPKRIIFGGGVIEVLPEMIPAIEKRVRATALKAATAEMACVRAQLHNDAGAIGAGALALRTFGH